MRHLYFLLVAILSLLNSSLWSQNQASNWYFGQNAGLNFSTNPPTITTNGAMSTANSCASMSDANGNLLFYTNGITVWDATHNSMANGTGLAGTFSSYQGCIILPQPGSSSLYYIFYAYAVCSSVTFTNTIYYSVVDMSLASGAGSVTTKNAVLYTGTSSSDNPSGKLAATRHCNGTDIWLLSKDGMYNSSTSWTPNFRAFLLTSTGPSTTAVVSAAATYSNNNYCDWWTGMKISPNGKKLGCTNYNYNNNNLGGCVELYDFDNSTGAVSNSLILTTNTNTWSYGRGCEFSSDATKFYASVYHWTSSSSTYNTDLYQWDLCAGSPTAIVASIYTVNSVPGTNSGFGMQLAPDGKIYMTVNNSQSQVLDVINSPNSLGSACAFSAQAQSIAPKYAWSSLPNFMTSYLIQRPPPVP
ncbi:MAG: hypothetical protein JNL60_14020, partial [Bacteroidia bacterium]|nr:hypothetical protein [Bacteroidia bacterium]